MLIQLNPSSCFCSMKRRDTTIIIFGARWKYGKDDIRSVSGSSRFMFMSGRAHCIEQKNSITFLTFLIRRYPLINFSVVARKSYKSVEDFTVCNALDTFTNREIGLSCVSNL